MLPLERQKKILEYVRKKKATTISELASYFDVHDATIRRDVRLLVKDKLLVRTHGGVMIDDEVHSEPSFQERKSLRFDEKTRIGHLAADLINDGENIIIDSGTTTLHLVHAIQDKKNLTIITNDINIAATLKSSKFNKVIVTGGILFPDSFMLNGMITDDVLRSLHVHKAFIGTPALHHKKGLTHFDEYLVSTKRGMIRASKQVIVVADHTKIGSVSLHKVADTKQIHDIITGKEAERSELQLYEEQGIRVHFA